MYAFVAFVAILGTLSLTSAGVLPRDVAKTVTSFSFVVVAPDPTPDSTIVLPTTITAIANTEPTPDSTISQVIELTTVFVAPEPSSVSNDKPTPVSAVEPEQPTETCHTNFYNNIYLHLVSKVVLDDFTIKGAGWDHELLDRDGKPGGGLRHELGGCGVITHWSFETQEPSVKNGPWEFIAHGQRGVFQALCIEHAMKSAGAPKGHCIGTS
ncbi:hypothetical protein LTR56_004150 [Elasticomyces elasticus]|nr:hypothetical protein LTR22_015355 [Elasticomyces elasticus]KAK3654096.1 hypothetical protein LTR56_004150 [Elasticomyces elasticus]KAK4914674.1 hypothetical protein LTR49_017116 [Elasticomyces elasticus]